MNCQSPVDLGHRAKGPHLPKVEGVTRASKENASSDGHPLDQWDANGPPFTLPRKCFQGSIS